ncbi:Ig domain-containing protein, partial [Clostridium sp. DJ247]|uniref:Ig-like domain-containing protein n=1 Tax=Clostridium sp. DJ247 TaxID=2726188 RepID=UPI0016251D8A
MTSSRKLMKKILVTFVIIVMNLTSFTAYAAGTVIEILDPTPDVTPPVLNSLNISSSQASPGNPVKITAEVSDELSGVNSVYISYRKPSGNSTGTYLNLNQTTQKYEGTISIGTYDEAGEWIPSYLALTDKKDNSGYVYDVNSTSSGQKFDFSPYRVTVSGVSIPPVTPESTDKVPPVLNSITTSTSQVSGPGTAKLIADVSDDDTGVYNVYAYYLKPSGRSYSLGLYFNSTTGKYEGNITIGQYDEIGDWKLNYVYLRDKAGNYKCIYDSALYPSMSEKQDFGNCKIYVDGITPDLIAPKLDKLSRELIQNTNNSALFKLFAEVSDELSGVSTTSVYGIYAKPSGKTITIRFNRNATTGIYEASIPIDKYDELGTWDLKYVSMSDNKNNYRTIYDGSSAEYFSLFDFIVRGVITISPVAPFSISVSPTKTMVLERGTSQQISTTLNMTDQTTKDITLGTSGTVYISSNPSAVKVSQDGLITVESNASPGPVYIQVTNGGLSEECKVVVPGAIPESHLQINPFSISLSSGQSKQLNVIESLADGTVKEVTEGSTGTKYLSSDTSMVTVDQNGLVQVLPGAKQGTARIQVDNNGIKGECVVTVTGPPTVKALAMTPATATVSYGETIQLSVRATMSDGSTKDVTNGSNGTVYTTSNSSRATVDANGLISIPANATSGTVTIKAINNNTTEQCVVTVNGVPTLSSIEVNSTDETLMPGDTSQISVVATMSDGITKDVTTVTSYNSSNTDLATVDTNGLVTIPTTATGGTVYIRGTYEGKGAAATLTVSNQNKTV